MPAPSLRPTGRTSPSRCCHCAAISSCATQGGVWACCNPKCSGRRGTDLDVNDWPFGAVYFEHRQTCGHCNSLVFAILTCNNCGEVYLGACEEARGA